MVAVAILGTPIVPVVGGLIGLGALIVALTADGNEATCIEACEEEYGTPPCQSDDDCDRNEYCFKGVGLLTANECRPHRFLDAACSRHGQCRSDCCKLHISQPFTKICRPADRCD